MAFFAWRGKTDKEDYEAFHIICGEDVTFSNGRRTAQVPTTAVGTVYSAKPIPTGAKFQVKVVEIGYYIVSDLLLLLLGEKAAFGSTKAAFSPSAGGGCNPSIKERGCIK